MAKLKDYRHTVAACFISFISQAICNVYAPLLYVTFQSEYHVSLASLALLPTTNFAVQLLLDAVFAKGFQKVHYRALMIMALLFSCAGITGLVVFPAFFSNGYSGLLLATVFCALGSGLLEIMACPIIDACPTRRKEAMMSLLHSFFCWGAMGVTLVSSLCFSAFGMENWRYVTLGWAMVPLITSICFFFIPIPKVKENRNGSGFLQLAKKGVFWLLVLVILCSGAAEQSLEQWASAFVEVGLGVSKTAGDLLGPCMFFAVMGLSRVFYAKCSRKIPLKDYMLFSSLLCVISYLMTSLSESPVLGLSGCALCGFSVGALWPGSYSLATAELQIDNPSLFAALALAGNVGCSGGPALVGTVSDAFSGSLRIGLLAAEVFPIVLALILLILKCRGKRLDKL